MGTIYARVPPVDVEIIDDDRVAIAVKRDGSFEPETSRVIGSICNKGGAGIFLDVGSYGALFGIAAALMKNQVVGFEPFPNNFKRSRANMALNSVDYRLVDIALSDTDGEAELGFNPRVALTSNASLERKGPARMMVKRARLDSLNGVVPKGRVGLVKIDVEGHEAQALIGMLEMIERDRPVLIVETLDHEERKTAVKRLLPKYEVKAFLDKRNLWLERK